MKTKYAWLQRLIQRYPSYRHRLVFLSGLVKRRAALQSQLESLAGIGRSIWSFISLSRKRRALSEELDGLNRSIAHWVDRAKVLYSMIAV